MTTRPFEVCCALSIALAFLPGAAQATKFRVLYSFAGGTDGAYPQANVLRDNAGNLYGTASYGGANNDGIVFRLAPAGAETVLYSFSGADGANPTDSLISDKMGNLYGTTDNGGSNNSGTVFKLAPDGSETVLYSFKGGSDGDSPYAGLLLRKGIFYGTTQNGGAARNGVVFALAADGTESVLHAFSGGNDGAMPLGGLVADKSGNLYGTTYAGGADGVGIVYKITPDGTETVLIPSTAAMVQTPRTRCSRTKQAISSERPSKGVQGVPEPFSSSRLRAPKPYSIPSPAEA